MPTQNTAAAVAFKIKCGEKEISTDSLVSFQVSLDMGQPDMCCVTVRNDAHEFSGSVSLGTPLEIKTEDGKPVFIGETVGMDSSYKAGGNNTLSIRGFNCLHRMLRTQRSQTFLKMTDEAIVERIVKNYPLQAQCGERASQSPPPDHIYQHNQTDLQFLRTRAARLAYDIWVEDNKILHFDAPNPSSDSQIQLRYGDAETATQDKAIFLEHFSPRMSSAGIVKEVEVRGWNPVTKEEIVGKFPTEGAARSPLGGKSAYDATYSGNGSGFQGMTSQSFEVDQPIHSIKEAEAIAENQFRQSAMGFITGEGACRGSAEIKLGAVVNITVNPDDAQDRFNGKYMVVGATHIYSCQGSGRKGGYKTEIRVRRDAEGVV